MVHSEDLKDDSTFLFRWALRKDEHARLLKNEHAMLHWICGIKVKEHVTVTELSTSAILTIYSDTTDSEGPDMVTVVCHGQTDAKILRWQEKEDVADPGKPGRKQ